MMPTIVGNTGKSAQHSIMEKERMSAPERLRSVVVALLLGPGLVAAANVDTDASNEQPIQGQVAPAMKPDTVPPVVMWPQMMPMARPMVYYWAPPPGMMWPVLPQYSAPMAMPPVVWVMVPVPATSLSPAMVEYGPVADTPVVEVPLTDEAPEKIMQEPPALPAPAVVDYGPVTDAPVVELPLPDTDNTQAMMEEAALAAALAQEVKVDAGPAAVAPGVKSAPMNGQSNAAGEPEAPTATASVNAPPVDYGPVTPTPVVDLLALEALGSGTPAPAKRPPKPVRKSGTPVSAKPMAKVKSEPSKRLCWTKGVVAPCR
jgi:hypothetical protein